MVATMAIDLTPHWDNFAVYLPAIQKGYAKAAYKLGDRDRVMPQGITTKDLNFLNPKSKLWHYGYGLYSAGQFKIGEQQADIVTNRDAATIILGDSGGYQIGKGTLQGFTALKDLKKAEDVCAAWSNAVELKTWIVNWLETHSNYAMTIDMPLWAKQPQNSKTPFHKCSTEQLIQLTVENLQFIDRNKRGNTKWLNVIQGTTTEDMKLWWDAVKDFRFGGWALAGDTGWRGGVGAVVRQVLMMRDEGAFVDGMDWMHVLGVSQAKWAVLLTAIQRGIRQKCNPNFRVSFDSASANILAGVYQQVAIYPKFTNKADSWSISAARCPIDKVYVSGNPSYAFPFPSPLGDMLKLHHLNVTHEAYSAKYFDELSHHLLTNHNAWVYVRAMLEANELAFLDKHDAASFVPPKLLECIYLIEDMIAGGAWEKKWKKNADLFDAVDKMKNDAVAI
jgi:hypothetical protein